MISVNFPLLLIIWILLSWSWDLTLCLFSDLDFGLTQTPGPTTETSHTVSLKDKTLLLGSLYTSWGSHHFRHDTHTFVSHSSRVLTWPPLCIIHRALYTHGFVALGVCHIPFLPVTLHRFKTDNLTILPASYVTPGTWWEMTDWKSSRRLILWKVWQGLLGFFPSSLATALLAGRSLSFRL